MGSSMSKKQTEKKPEHKVFMEKIRSNVEDEIARRMMIQREIQMAVNVARARDTLWIFGSAWATLVTGATTAKLLGKPVPPVLVVPVVIGGLALGNMADMAYGNKLNRIVKEAEYIMDNEKGRFVPCAQAPFAKFYLEQDREGWHDQSTPVGELFPNNLIARSNSSPKS